MTAEILAFRPPAKAEGHGGGLPEAGQRLAAGDILLTCWNRTAGLWCAWPIAAVDRDGVPTAVRTRGGELLAADRVNAGEEAYGVKCPAQDRTAFEALYWRGWPSAEVAMVAVADAVSKVVS